MHGTWEEPAEASATGCRKKEVGAGHKKTGCERGSLKTRCSCFTAETSTCPVRKKRIKTPSLSRVSILTFVYRTVIFVWWWFPKETIKIPYSLSKANFIIYCSKRDHYPDRVLGASWKTRAIRRFGGASLKISECWGPNKSWLNVVK